MSAGPQELAEGAVHWTTARFVVDPVHNLDLLIHR